MDSSSGQKSPRRLRGSRGNTTPCSATRFSIVGRPWADALLSRLTFLLQVYLTQLERDGEFEHGAPPPSPRQGARNKSARLRFSAPTQ